MAVALFAAYAATLGLDAFGESDYGGDEPHYLLAAQSLAVDGDLDVLDQYGRRTYAGFYPLELDTHGQPSGGVLHEPHGAGFPALITPAFTAGGATGVEVFVALLAAASGVLAYFLARRVVPGPWAIWATLAVGLSPPVLAYGTAVYPELPAGAALAGAALLALRLEERPRAAEALACASLLAALPWLGAKYVPAGVVIGVFAVRCLRRRGRRLLAVAGVQLVGASAIAYVLVNEALYGGPTPYAADVEGETGTDAAFPVGYLERSYRLAALLVDRDYGLLRWAPVLALALVGAWLLWRARSADDSPALNGNLAELGPRSGPNSARFARGRSDRGRAADDRPRIDRRAREAAGLCASALAAQFLVAAFLAPTMFGFWFPGRHLLAALPLSVPLVGLGMRRFPRTGMALAVLGAIASLWLYVAVGADIASLAVGWPDVPWGPLDVVLPYYGRSPLPYALTGAAAAVGLAVAVGLRLRSRARLRSRTAVRQARQVSGATRRRYSR